MQLYSRHTDLEFSFIFQSPAFSLKMLSNETYDEINPDYDDNKIDEQLEQKICVTNLCIPKIEPCYLNISRSNEDIFNTVSKYYTYKCIIDIFSTSDIIYNEIII